MVSDEIKHGLTYKLIATLLWITPSQIHPLHTANVQADLSKMVILLLTGVLPLPEKV